MMLHLKNVSLVDFRTARVEENADIYVKDGKIISQFGKDEDSLVS